MSEPEKKLRLTKIGAKHLATQAAWTVQDEETGTPGRTVIHSRAGGIGADWDLDDVLTFIDDADEVGFAQSFLGHELFVAKKRENGHERLVFFEAPEPRTSEEIDALTALGGLVAE